MPMFDADSADAPTERMDVEPNRLTRPVWQREPVNVYVHVPFCTQRCGYCNFALIAGRGDLVESYLQALECELRLKLGAPSTPKNISTLFFGGGTPTFLSPSQVERLISILRLWYSWEPAIPDWECTVEANPNDLNADLIACWRAFGVNRFSLGAQSFQSDKLRRLERTHSGDDVRRAAELVLQSGARLSLDLIFGLHDEAADDWAADLQAAESCEPHHLSTYQLTYEKGTQFWNRLQKGQDSEVDQDRALDLYRLTKEFLEAAGWEHYEVSNFARPGFRCRHNSVYWTGRPYAAFGPGAASYLGGVRSVNHASTTTYIKKMLKGESPVTDRDQDGPEMRAREYFVFGMRLLDGIDPHTYHHETGYDLFQLLGTGIERDVRAGYFHWNADRLQLTNSGLYLSDSLWPNYLTI